MKQLIINGAVRLLPTHLQARYAEQWQADLDGAAELGIKPWSIVWGALITSISLYGKVEFTPLKRTHTVADRAQITLGFWSGILVFLLVSYFFETGYAASIQEFTGWPLALDVLLQLEKILVYALVLGEFVATAWFLSTFVPSRFRALTTTIITGIFCVIFVSELATPISTSSLIPLSAFLPGVLTLVFLVWAKFSYPLNHSEILNSTSQISLLTVRRILLLGFALAIPVFPVYALVIFPLLIPGQPMTIAEYVSITLNHTATNYQSGAGLIVLTVMMFIGIGGVYALGKFACTMQGLLALICCADSVVALFILAQFKENIYRPVNFTQELPQMNALVLQVCATAFMLVLSWSLVLALAPRIRSSEELDAHENVETRALIS